MVVHKDKWGPCVTALRRKLYRTGLCYGFIDFIIFRLAEQHVAKGEQDNNKRVPSYSDSKGMVTTHFYSSYEDRYCQCVSMRMENALMPFADFCKNPLHSH